MKFHVLVFSLMAALSLGGCLKHMEDIAAETKGVVGESHVTMKEMKKLATKEGAMHLMNDHSASPHARFLGAFKLITDREAVEDKELNRQFGAAMPLWDFMDVPSMKNMPNVTVIAEKTDPYLGKLVPMNMDTYLVAESAVMTMLTLIVSNLQLPEYRREPFPKLASYVERLIYVGPTILGARRWDPINHKMGDKPVLEEPAVRAANAELGFPNDPHVTNRSCAAKDLLALVSVPEIADLISQTAKEHLPKAIEKKMAVNTADIDGCTESAFDSLIRD